VSDNYANIIFSLCFFTLSSDDRWASKGRPKGGTWATKTVSNTEFPSCDPEPAHRFTNLASTTPRKLKVEAGLLHGSLNHRTVSHPVVFAPHDFGENGMPFLMAKETQRAFNDNAGERKRTL